MYWYISDETIEQIKQALIDATHDAPSKRDIAYDLLDSQLYAAGSAYPDINILSRGRVRELIVCLMQHCDIKAHDEKNARIISNFIKEFYNDLL